MRVEAGMEGQSKGSERPQIVILTPGDAPRIAGTRITVYDVYDYYKLGDSNPLIATRFRLSSEQVQAAIDYIESRKDEVVRNHNAILERHARGNPPELQGRLAAAHDKFTVRLKELTQKRSHAPNNG
jgi:uncharacterized protein (DUF433 family)